MCEKQETFGGRCVSVGGEIGGMKKVMDGKGGRISLIQSK